MLKSIMTLAIGMVLSTLVLAGGPVNINEASAEELAEVLQGVGPAKAEAIVEYREANGDFTDLDELVNVQGIGIRTVDLNRDHMTASDD